MALAGLDLGGRPLWQYAAFAGGGIGAIVLVSRMMHRNDPSPAAPADGVALDSESRASLNNANLMLGGVLQDIQGVHSQQDAFAKGLKDFQTKQDASNTAFSNALTTGLSSVPSISDVTSAIGDTSEASKTYLAKLVSLNSLLTQSKYFQTKSAKKKAAILLDPRIHGLLADFGVSSPEALYSKIDMLDMGQQLAAAAAFGEGDGSASQFGAGIGGD